MSQPADTPLKTAYNKYRAVLGAAILFSFAVNLLMFVSPMYMLQIYDRVLVSRNETTLVMITLIAIMLLVAYGLLEFTRSRLLVRAGLQFDRVIANPLFDRIMRVKLASNGQAGGPAIGDADRVRDFITGQGIFAFFDAPWTPLFLGLCFAMHPYLGIVASVGAVIIFILALLNELLTRAELEAANTAGTAAQSFAGASLQNAEIIRAMGMTDALSARWQTQRAKMLLAQTKASDSAGAILAISKFTRMALQIAILGTGAYLAMQQEISPGIMIAASIIMGRALAPVEQAVGQWKQFISARQAHGRLKLLFDNLPEELPRIKLPAPTGQLQVEDLTAFLPGAKEPILKSVSFGIQAGDVLAIIGPSGSGKSTLVRHLVGVATPKIGKIRLDGTELPHWDRTQLGQCVGYLSQDIRLFSGTVAENIARFQPDASDEDIISAATLAGAHPMISGLANGYQTEIGEGGSRLSGGQRQRIGLARAVYNLPSLIVLDEPNSNLDGEGEMALANCIKQLKEMGKTVILVTHKVNLLAASDKIVVMGQGKVQRFGLTQDIMQNPQHP